MIASLWLPIVVAPVALMSGGCALFRGEPIDAGADPYIVHAQRTRNYALDTFDGFLSWEKKNRAILNSPQTKAAADLIRADYTKWDNTLGEAIKAYSTVKNSENAGKLDIALALIQKGLELAAQYSNPNLALPPPAPVVPVPVPVVPVPVVP